MLSDYKLLVIEMTAKEWGDIAEGVRRVHPELEELSDEQIENFVKEVEYAHLCHCYIDFVDKYKQQVNQR